MSHYTEYNEKPEESHVDRQNDLASNGKNGKRDNEFNGKESPTASTGLEDDDKAVRRLLLKLGRSLAISWSNMHD